MAWCSFSLLVPRLLAAEVLFWRSWWLIVLGSVWRVCVVNGGGVGSVLGVSWFLWCEIVGDLVFSPEMTG